MKSKSMNLLQKACLVIYLFMAIFQPNILGVGTFKLILLVDFAVFAFLVVKYQRVLFNKKVMMLFAGFLPFVLYLFVSAMIHILKYPGNAGIYMSNFTGAVLPLFQCMILGLVMVLLIKVKGIEYSEIENALLFVSLIQLGCVLLALFVPQIRNMFIDIMLRDTDASRISDFLRFGSTRMYGLSRNLFDLFGYIVSILITLVFLKGVSENKNIYKLISVVLLIIPLLNARTGLVLALVGFAVVLAFYFTPKKLPLYAVGGVAAVVCVIVFFSLLPEKNAEWLTKGFDDTVTYLKTGEKVGVYSEILGKDIVYPSNMVFGECGAPEALRNYSGIDSGYIQCLWRYGIIGSAFLFFGYINMFYIAAFRNKSKKACCMMAVLAMLFFVYLFKLYALDNAGANILVFGIPLSLLACEKFEDNKNRNLLRLMVKRRLCK